ncbi:hypothetical protein [Streptosporangium canum]|uniref:hypothetical protein n=1 Tax=Streptosporangium canum TaxID=324952 RepID=UPI003793ECF1
MGTRPCKQRRARLTAGALLALQISLIASASHDAAAADATRSSTAATTSVRASVPVSVPVSAIRPAGARTAVTETYDADVLATARSPYRQETAPRTETATRTETKTRAETKTKTKAGAEAGTTSRTEAAASSHPIQPIRIGHVQATQQLRKAGLRWKSSGGCTDRSVRTCTSLEAVRAATVTDVIALKQRSGCPVVVTGGTEVGHAPGRYSHHRGYKLDIKPNDCINRYITREHVLDGIRGDGAPLYRDSGTVYARESDHWDILFR